MTTIPSLPGAAAAPPAPTGGAPSPAGPAVLTSKQIRLMLLGVMLGMLLAMLDNAIVGTALPTITGDLGGLRHLSWVVTAYTLATAVSTPVWGKFGDLRGRKNVFLAAIAVFVTGSVLSGAAQSMIELIAFRALQGLGAGGLAVGAFAIIADLVSPRERGRYQGMTASVMAVGTIGGPLLGGVITTDLGWRWAFYINVPLGLAAFAWCQVMLPRSVRRTARIDWLGTVLLGAAITGLVLITTWGGSQYRWASVQVIGLSVLTVAAVAAFIVSQRHATEPVLPLRIFTHRNLPLACIIALVVGVAMFGCVVYLPQFQQSVQGANATGSGLLLLPLVIPIVFISQIVGRVMSTTGKYKIFPILGAGFLITGMGLLATMNTATSRTTTSAYMVLIGIGLGFAMQMTTTIAQNSVPMTDLGVASAAVTLFRTIGGSVGVALFGSLFTRALTHGLPAGTEQPTAAQLPHLPAAARDAYLHSVAHGTHTIFTVGAAVAVAALIAALFIIEMPLRGKPTTPTEPTPAEPTPAHTVSTHTVSTHTVSTHTVSTPADQHRGQRASTSVTAPTAP